VVESGTQVPHPAHILLPGQGVNHRAGAQEQQRLKESMRHKVEHASHKRTHTHGSHHEAELADR